MSYTRSKVVSLDAKEIAIIIAGLRLWQRLDFGDLPERDIATNAGLYARPLDDCEIDQLIERIQE